jgi:ATP cone domain
VAVKANTSAVPAAQMNVRKRNGTLEPINLSKIIKAVTRAAAGISDVDPVRVATKTIGGIHDGVTTQELDQLSIQTAVSLIPEHANYSNLAASLLAEVIRKEVAGQGFESFSQSIDRQHLLGFIPGGTWELVITNRRKFDNAIDDAKNANFGFYALEHIYKHLLARDPETGKVIETPQQFFLRVALWTTGNAREALKQYKAATEQDIASWTKTVEAVNTIKEINQGPGVEEPYYVRPLMPGMGQAVAERTVLRRDEAGTWENWGQVADRVALGNSLLASTPLHSQEREHKLLRKFIAKAALLMSGRHLQHGDKDQPSRNMEVFTNCSTAATSFLEFYLLLNGSGVGRAYDDDMMLVDWDNAPSIRCVLDSDHPDFVWGSTESVRDARHKYGAPSDLAWFEVPPAALRTGDASADFAVWESFLKSWEERTEHTGHKIGEPRFSGDKVIWFQVPDSREGWAKALELWEVLAFEKVHKDKTLILDFTPVRPKKSPIGGMQNRPASGPQPLMNAFLQAAALKGAGLPRWKQTIYIDHYFAECVLVGGARRAARMATKSWRDKQVLDFITVKRPIEYIGQSAADIEIIRKRRAMTGQLQFQGFLWSSNNSITVDKEFWAFVESTTPESEQTELAKHAKAVFELSTAAAYGDGTGEPGFINVDKLVQKDRGYAELLKGEFVESPKYKLNDDTHLLMSSDIAGTGASLGICQHERGSRVLPLSHRGGRRWRRVADLTSPRK